jgi:membrane associated rhomboid family serine protease
MRPPPPLSRLVNYPVVGGTAALAIAVTLVYWGKQVDVGPLMPSLLIREGQLWRLLTCILPHGDLMHLGFNVYWLWVFGSLVEEAFGHLRTLALIVVLALASSAAEFALLHGGIGLSGVGYGLFGFLWVLSRRDDRFEGAIDPNTIGLFVLWFFLCIAMTMTNVMPVANIAHGVGAVLGALIGLSVSAPRRAPYASLTVLLLVACAAGVWARPFINLTDERAEELGRMGYRDLLAHRDAAALRHLRAALAVREDFPGAWYNLGIAYGRLGDEAKARDAFRRAAEMEPASDEFRTAAREAEREERASGQRDGTTIAPAPATTRSIDTP